MMSLRMDTWIFDSKYVECTAFVFGKRELTSSIVFCLFLGFRYSQSSSKFFSRVTGNEQNMYEYHKEPKIFITYSLYFSSLSL